MSKRLMVVSRNYPPLTGGMERLNFHLVQELSRDFEVVLVGPSGAENYAPDAVRVITCSSWLAMYLLLATVKSISAATVERPALIFAGSGLNVVPAYLAAKVSGAKLGIYLHGLDLVFDSWIYQKVFVSMIRRADFWFANSSATRRVAEQRGVRSEDISVINPGVSIPAQSVDDELSEIWKRDRGLIGKRVILVVGRLTKRKGLREFIENCMGTILTRAPDAVLLVVGDAPPGFLPSRKNIKTELVHISHKLGIQEHCRFIGSVADAELEMAYRSASVHVFPILNLPGDMEGFGMVALEAAAHGVPTVAFNVGGVGDAVSDKFSGHLVTSGDYSDFSSKVLEVLNSEDGSMLRSHCSRHAEKFSWSGFGEKIRMSIAKELRECPAK